MVKLNKQTCKDCKKFGKDKEKGCPYPKVESDTDARHCGQFEQK